MSTTENIGGYHLVRRLGTGGAGTVWLAEDGGGTQVALKLLHPALAATEEARTRLQRECRIVNSIPSTSVARVLDIEVDDLQPFVVTEFIEGPSLSELLKDGHLSAKDLAALARSLYDTLSSVHGARVVHRDVKPSNIICAARGPVLIDFGIALGEDDQRLTSTGLVSGTAGYTAPELLRGDEAAPASDWWALAATLVHAATGRPPFGRGSMESVLARVTQGDPDLDGLPAALLHPLVAALDPVVDRRMAPLELVEALEAAAGRQPGTAIWTGIPTPISIDEATDATTVLEPKAVASDVPPTAVQATEVQPSVSNPVSNPTLVLPPVAEPYPATASPQVGQHPVPQVATAPYSAGAYPAAAYPEQPYDPAGAFPPAAPNAPGMAGPGGPYIARRPRPAWLLGLVLLTPAATVPALAGQTGVLVVLVVLIVATWVGSIHAGQEKRRQLAGGKRPTDWIASLGWAPLRLLQAIAAIAAGQLLGWAVATGIWWVLYDWALTEFAFNGAVQIGPWTSFDVPNPDWPLTLVAAQEPQLGADDWLSDPVWAFVAFALVWVCLVVTWIMPTSGHLRRGAALAFEALAPFTWLRLVLGLLAIFMTVGVWILVTGV